MKIEEYLQQMASLRGEIDAANRELERLKDEYGKAAVELFPYKLGGVLDVSIKRRQTLRGSTWSEHEFVLLDVVPGCNGAGTDLIGYFLGDFYFDGRQKTFFSLSDTDNYKVFGLSEDQSNAVSFNSNPKPHE